jgi:hypothetical protein
MYATPNDDMVYRSWMVGIHSAEGSKGLSSKAANLGERKTLFGASGFKKALFGLNLWTM